MKDRKVQKEEQSQNTNNIRNTRIKDSGAKLIFDNPILCAQFLRGYTDVDIAKRIGIRNTTFRSRLERAKKILSEEFPEFF